MTKIKPLTKELQYVAQKELGEVPERMPKDLKMLRSWIEQQPHLNARLDEQFLIQYLRGCKYDYEKAKQKIDFFFTLKTKYPAFANATEVNQEKFKKIHDYGFSIPLPRPLNDNGARIHFIKFDGDIGKGLVDFDDLHSVFTAIQEILIMEDEYACINGIIYLLDIGDISVNMASKFTPAFLRKLVQLLEKSLPFRIKSIHMINMSTIFQNVMNILLPMFSEKLRKRVHFYSKNNYNDLFKFIPQEYLPEYLGGNNGCVTELIKNFNNKWLEYENYFKENANYGTNELLRPGGPIDFEGLYGLGGTFRKLTVD